MTFNNNSSYISELRLIILIGLVQFIDILDFMIVMPLGPDFAKSLNINQSQLGLTAVFYTISAAISGVLSATFIDKFERKKLLIFSLLGMISAIFIASFAKNFETLLAARFLAGSFGGPTTALSFAIITDLVDEKKRGYVIGKIMSAFSIAATVGVPISLAISRYYGWRYTFLSIACLGLIVIFLISVFLPKIDTHLNSNVDNKIKVTYKSLFGNFNYFICFMQAGLGLMAAFMIIPYISAYLQLNLDFPRENIEILYIFGGVMSFITVQLIGKIIDAKSSSLVSFVGLIFIICFLYFAFINTNDNLPIYPIYACFMIGMSMRNVANSTLVTKLPKNHDRAGFMSFVSMFQHVFSALGSYLTTIILFQENISSPLQNMNVVAFISMIIFTISLLMLKYLEKRVRS